MNLLRILFINALAFFISTPAWSCSICFYGDSDDPINRGLRMGIFTLLIFLVVILGIFATFFLKLRRRSQTLTEVGDV